MLNGFQCTRLLRRHVQRDLRGILFSKMSRICEYGVIMGIVTGLLGRCL